MMIKPIAIATTIAVLLFGSVITFNMIKQHNNALLIQNQTLPVFPVTASTVAPTTFTPVIDTIGVVEPVHGTMLSTVDEGVIDALSFKEGQFVEAGSLLLSLDTAVEQANLKAAQANLTAAENKYHRSQQLFHNHTLSKAALEGDQANYLALKAQINSLKATIHRRQVVAPFSGIIGISKVTLGQYVGAGHEVALLEDTSTMKLMFTINQRDIRHIHERQRINIIVDAYPEKPFEGIITAINPGVNAHTGLILVQAHIPNPNKQLHAGMFAKVVISLTPQHNQLLIPQTAVSYHLYGESVYVLHKEKDQLTADMTTVRTGKHQGNQVQILSGLTAGDRIVTTGQIRLTNHARVKVAPASFEQPEQLPVL